MDPPYRHLVGFMEESTTLHTSAAPGVHAFLVAHTGSPAIYYEF